MHCFSPEFFFNFCLKLEFVAQLVNDGEFSMMINQIGDNNELWARLLHAASNHASSSQNELGCTLNYINAS